MNTMTLGGWVRWRIWNQVVVDVLMNDCRWTLVVRSMHRLSAAGNLAPSFVLPSGTLACLTIVIIGETPAMA
jgi:hypothetical protein